MIFFGLINMHFSPIVICGFTLMVNLQADGGVEYAHTENRRQLELMRQLYIDPRNLDEVADDLHQRREKANHDPRRRMTDYLLTKRDSDGKSEGSPDGKKEGNKESHGETEKTGKKRGRPPGSKNKKTIEREARLAGDNVQKPIKRKPGRPPGSKNKKTLEMEAKEAAEAAERAARGEPEPVKRKRGRPPGSRNKPKPPQIEEKNKKSPLAQC